LQSRGLSQSVSQSPRPTSDGQSQTHIKAPVGCMDWRNHEEGTMACSFPSRIATSHKSASPLSCRLLSRRQHSQESLICTSAKDPGFNSQLGSGPRGVGLWYVAGVCGPSSVRVSNPGSRWFGRTEPSSKAGSRGWEEAAAGLLRPCRLCSDGTESAVESSSVRIDSAPIAWDPMSTGGDADGEVVKLEGQEAKWLPVWEVCGWRSTPACSACCGA